MPVVNIADGLIGEGRLPAEDEVRLQHDCGFLAHSRIRIGKVIEFFSGDHLVKFILQLRQDGVLIHADRTNDTVTKAECQH